MKVYDNNVKLGKRPSLARRVLLGVNLTVILVLGIFMIWDYYSEWRTYISEKKIALEEEAKILLISVLELKERGTSTIQGFIDDACGTMQESTSPGHHIAVQMGTENLQAQAHRRASPVIFLAMQNAIKAPDGLASIGDTTLVVGSAFEGDVVIYVSEYLYNIKRIVQSQMLRRILSILGIALTLAIVLNIVLHKLVAAPLRGMVNTVQQFGQGEHSNRMPRVQIMELGVLADEFDQMAEAIETADNDRHAWMEKAKEIQQNLLPISSMLSNIKHTCLFQPVTEVAGDYYDIIRFSDNTVLLCVADVVGHDVPAALSAGMLKAILKTAAEDRHNPKELIYLIHSAFSQVTLEGDFATMILVYLDSQKGTLEYVSAGHEKGYLIQSQGQIEELNPTGPIFWHR
ncbi:PP2C family protein-serine/threonine phosphatase [Planctomycetota bacterium]